MIRRRIPAVDDRAIYQLVLLQLLPYSRMANPQVQARFPDVKGRLNRNGFTFVAAEGQSAPYGFVTGVCRDRRLFIDMLALDERNQGRGLGTMLMQAAEEHGRRLGCREAFLYVDESNPRAQRFYFGKGYTIENYEPSVRCYKMTKRLM